MRYLILLITTILLAPYAEAGCLRHPKRCAKKADERRRRATQTFIDVATAGHTKRERERAEARNERESAAQQRAAAKATLDLSIKNKEGQLVNSKQRIVFTDYMENSIKIVQEYAVAMAPLLEQLYISIQTDKTRAEQIQTLIDLQRKSLENFINTDITNRKSEENQAREQKKLALKRQLEEYTLQISSFPISKSNPEDVQNWLDLTEEKSTSIMIFCNETLSWLKTEREEAQKTLAQQEQELALLKGEVKP